MHLKASSRYGLKETALRCPKKKASAACFFRELAEVVFCRVVG